MKNNYLIFLLFLSFTFVACNEDEDAVVPRVDPVPDTVAPVIKVHTPSTDTVIMLFHGFRVRAELKDDSKLEQVRIVLHDTSTDRMHLLSDMELWSEKYTGYYDVDFHYMVPRYSSPGAFRLMVEAKDKGNNVTKTSLNVHFITPALSKSEFDKPFLAAFGSSNILVGLDWYGYNVYDRGYAFDEDWLSIILNFMIDRENWEGLSEREWTKFIKDFNFKNQSWAAWDADADGLVYETEFNKGIKGLHLLREWDTNQDKVIHLQELSAGIFSRWDHDRDNVLSKEEYLGKFYDYLYSKKN